jgi:glycosyltransferase involved in cell wall biosynthesis
MSMAQKISACWIVKNETLFLARSLASVAGVADEILVGDTGSTDESIEIAQNAGARVVKIPWNGSYADARNAVMAYATGSWILFLDGDELLEPSHGALIRELVENKEVEAYYLDRRHYLRAPLPVGLLPISAPLPPIPIDALGYILTHDVRLFRASGRYFYQGRIHESLEGSLGAHQVSIIRSSAIIHHFGPCKSDDQLVEKIAHYVSLAAKRYEQEPENWKALFDYAVELSRAGYRDEALLLLEKGLEIFPEQWEIHLEYGIFLHEAGRQGEAIIALRSVVESRPHWVRGWHTLGLAFLRESDLATAALCFEQCQLLSPDEGISLLNWGTSLLLQGDIPSAQDRFSRVETLFPQLPQATLGRRICEVLAGSITLAASELIPEDVTMFGGDTLWQALQSIRQP